MTIEVTKTGSAPNIQAAVTVVLTVEQTAEILSADYGELSGAEKKEAMKERALAVAFRELRIAKSSPTVESLDAAKAEAIAEYERRKTLIPSNQL